MEVAELIKKADDSLLKQNPSERYVRRHRHIWEIFSHYSKKHDIKEFSTDLLSCFLDEEFGIELTNESHSKQEYENYIRPLLLLSNINSGGTFLRITKFDRVAEIECFSEVIDHYKLSCQKINNKKSTIDAKLWTIKPFLLLLSQDGVTDISGLQARYIHEFILVNAGRALKSINQRMNHLRAFIVFLFDNKYISLDLSGCVIVPPKPNPRLVQTWTKDEIAGILSVIERGTSVGKRDYAVFMLVTQLGLRTSDITHMVFDNIIWSECKISLIQQKTGIPLDLPLLEAVGDAIIDYLKYGRPKEDKSQYIFVRHTAPFGKIENFWRPMQRYLQAAHITVHKEKPHGFHSFRFTLATRLLEEEVPIETISAVLGHSSSDSTQRYLRADINKLRQCALNPEAVYG